MRCVEIMICTVWQYGGAWVANMADFTHLHTDRCAEYVRCAMHAAVTTKVWQCGSAVREG